MKILVCIVTLSLLLWPACNSEPNRAQENREAERARQERQMYRDRAEAKLRDLDRQIDALRARMEKDGRVERKRLDPQMDGLEGRRAIAHQKLEKLKTSSQEAWQEVKSEIDRAMDDLDAAYKQADSHLRQ